MINPHCPRTRSEPEHPPTPPPEPSEDSPINPIVLSKRSGSRRGGNAYVTSATPDIPSSSNFAYSPFAGPQDTPQDHPSNDAGTSNNTPGAAVDRHDGDAHVPNEAAGTSLPPYCGAPFCTLGEQRRAHNMQMLHLNKDVQERVPLLDRVTALVGKLLDCSVCIVDFVDHEQLYIKSAQNWAHSRTGDRRFSICTWWVGGMG